MTRAGEHLNAWTGATIDAECSAAYTTYLRRLRDRHIAYFAARPERRSTKYAFGARDLHSALPKRWAHLAHALPPNAWHRHHLSGGSSQLLAIALLAAATRGDPSLRWLGGDAALTRPLTLFEVELAPAVLNERPRQTAIDWLVVDRENVLTAEAKFTERGLGQCSCEHRKAGVCSTRVLARPYWSVASRDMALTRTDQACTLSLAYQAVRNVAAAQGIARRRRTTFLLLYDERNPYFVGARSWPGWAIMLKRLMSNSSTAFAALSWQELLTNANVGADVQAWAREKHGL